MNWFVLTNHRGNCVNSARICYTTVDSIGRVWISPNVFSATLSQQFGLEQSTGISHFRSDYQPRYFQVSPHNWTWHDIATISSLAILHFVNDLTCVTYRLITIIIIIIIRWTFLRDSIAWLVSPSPADERFSQTRPDVAWNMGAPDVLSPTVWLSRWWQVYQSALKLLSAVLYFNAVQIEPPIDVFLDAIRSMLEPPNTAAKTRDAAVFVLIFAALDRFKLFAVTETKTIIRLD